MSLNDSEFRDYLLSVSSGLRERSDNLSKIQGRSTDPEEVKYWHNFWKEILDAKDVFPKFDVYTQRLKKLNLRNFKGFTKLFQSPNIPFPTPFWVDSFMSIDQNWKSTPIDMELLKYAKVKNPTGFPFIEIYIKIVKIARKDLMAKLGHNSNVLSRKSWLEIEFNFLKFLSIMCSKTYATHLSIVKAEGKLSGDSPESRYQFYLKIVLNSQNGYREIFKTYPVLAKIIGTLTRDWLDENTEFINRYLKDFKLINKYFFQNTLKNNNITKIIPNLSDPHCGRRFVKIITVGKKKIVYKPKDIGLEKDYNLFIEWLSNQKGMLQHKHLQVLAKNGYGWVEYIQNENCTNETEIKKYYQRSGSLLAILYALQATDCHSENILASGQYPVLIDTESLFHCWRDNSKESVDADILIAKRYNSSVFQTGMLPNWKFYEKGKEAFDISGIGGSVGKILPFSVPKWANLNRDDLMLSYHYPKMSGDQNAPKVNSKRVSLNDYQKEIAFGFKTTYEFFMNNKLRILKSKEFTKMFTHDIRYINHNSQFYFDLLHSSCNPDFLMRGVTWDLQFEILYQSLSQENHKVVDKLIESEIEFLRDLDIPIFHVKANTKALITHKHGIIRNFFDHSSRFDVERRIKNLSSKDLQEQLGYVKASLYSYQHNIDKKPEKMRTSNIPNRKVREIPIKKIVLSLAKILIDRRIEVGNGEISWIDIESNNETNQVIVQGLSNNLYSGKMGIAIFFSALYKFTKQKKYKKIAQKIVNTFVSRIKRDAPISDDVSIGGMDGIGGVVYALAKIGHLLDEKKYVDSAIKFSQKIDDKRISRDQNLDIITGSAGALLSLDYVYNVTKDPNIYILIKKVSIYLCKSWQKRLKMDSLPPTGFSHGLAGMSYSLAKSFLIIKNKNIPQIVSRMNEAENKYFLKSTNSWCNPKDNKNIKRTSWCSGVSGIGFSRLENISNGTSKIDFINCVESIMGGSVAKTDTVCCGQIGEIDFLYSLSHYNPSQYKAIFENRLDKLVQSYSKNKRFNLYPGMPSDVYNFGFMQGLSGIGYYLLRFLDPKTFGSIILFE